MSKVYFIPVKSQDTADISVRAARLFEFLLKEEKEMENTLQYAVQKQTI